MNRLKLKDDKTEAMILSTGRKSRSLVSPFPNSVTRGSAICSVTRGSAICSVTRGSAICSVTTGSASVL